MQILGHFLEVQVLHQGRAATVVAVSRSRGGAAGPGARPSDGAGAGVGSESLASVDRSATRRTRASSSMSEAMRPRMATVRSWEASVL